MEDLDEATFSSLIRIPPDIRNLYFSAQRGLLVYFPEASV